MDENLYDEFGNYIGPELDEDDDDDDEADWLEHIPDRAEDVEEADQGAREEDEDPGNQIVLHTSTLGAYLISCHAVHSIKNF